MSHFKWDSTHFLLHTLSVTEEADETNYFDKVFMTYVNGVVTHVEFLFFVFYWLIPAASLSGSIKLYSVQPSAI